MQHVNHTNCVRSIDTAVWRNKRAERPFFVDYCMRPMYSDRLLKVRCYAFLY